LRLAEVGGMDAKRKFYVRFQSQFPDWDMGMPCGIFQTITHVTNSTSLPEYALEAIDLERAWFSQNLHSPVGQFRQMRRRWPVNAISWFTADAVEHIRHAMNLKAILEEFSFPLDVLKSSNPGKIVYRDKFQVGVIGRY
jgi:hypothetical protein